MRNIKQYALLVSLTLLLFQSCGTRQVAPEPAAKDSIGEFASSNIVVKMGHTTITTSSDTAILKKFLNLDVFRPYAAQFQYTFRDNSGADSRSAVPGPSDFDLQAVLYFDSSTFARIIQQNHLTTWVSSTYEKSEFNFEWLNKKIKEELAQSDSIPKGYVDLFGASPNDPNCHIWMLNQKLLLHSFSR